MMTKSKNNFIFFFFFLTLQCLPLFAHEKLRIGTWNIRDFGHTKANRQPVLNVIVEVINHFDLLFIQELSQEPNEECGNFTSPTTCLLQDALNQNQNGQFQIIVSPRVGVEQYGVVFRIDKVSYVRGFFHEASETDFARPPFIFQMRLKNPSNDNPDFLVATIHTRPTDATSEIFALLKVIKHMENIDPDILVLGDFNSDGSYFDESDWSQFFSSIPGYGNIINDTQDTTVDSNNDHTYDRIVASPSMNWSDASVFYFNNSIDLSTIKTVGCQEGYPYLTCPNPTNEEASQLVSDHFPVGATFSFLRTSPDDSNSSVLLSPFALFVVSLTIFLTTFVQ